jgi:hypothetical protein
MIEESIGLTTKIEGLSLPDYMAQLIAKNDDQSVEIERGKLNVSVLKQLNNFSRTSLDAMKYELKKREYDDSHQQIAQA